MRRIAAQQPRSLLVLLHEEQFRFRWDGPALEAVGLPVLLLLLLLLLLMRLLEVDVVQAGRLAVVLR